MKIRIIMSILLCLLLVFLWMTNENFVQKNLTYKPFAGISEKNIENLVVGNLEFIETEGGGTTILSESCANLRCNSSKKVHLQIPAYYKVVKLEEIDERYKYRLSVPTHVNVLEVKDADYLILFVQGENVKKVWSIGDNDNILREVVKDYGNLDFKSTAEKIISGWSVQEYIKCENYDRRKVMSLHIRDSISHACRERISDGGYVIKKPSTFLPKLPNGDLMIGYYFVSWPVDEVQNTLR